MGENNNVANNVAAPIVISSGATFDTAMYVREHVICGKFWRQTDEYKEAMLRAALAELNAMFTTDIKLQIFIDSGMYEMTGGGKFDQETNTIQLHKFSLMTFLHVFAIAIVYNGYALSNTEAPLADVANWSHTVFCCASRKVYKKAVEKGLFFYEDVVFLAPLDNAVDEDSVNAAFLDTFVSWCGPNLLREVPENFHTSDMRVALEES